MVPRRRVIGGQLLHHHIGRPVPHLAACDMAVDNIDNGVFRILRGQIVNHNLTVWPELGRQGICNLLEHLQPVALQGDHLLTFQSDIHICIIPASSRDCNVLANIFLGLRKKCLISAGPKNQAASTSFADAA